MTAPRIEDRIDADLKAAMKARRRHEMDVLRFLKHTIGQDSRERPELEVLHAIFKHVLLVRGALDTAALYKRDDHADAAIGELEILLRYLPPALTDAELRETVTNVIEELSGFAAPTVGAVMRALVPRISGRADLAHVHQVVQALLKPG